LRFVDLLLALRHWRRPIVLPFAFRPLLRGGGQRAPQAAAAAAAALPRRRQR
jgi:hypothetical protein